MSKTISYLTLLILFCSIFINNTAFAVSPGKIEQSNITLEYRNVTVYAPAVAQTQNGYAGAISTITVTIQNNGSGRVFVDTLPLAQLDMQGSARLAVKVASGIIQNDNNCEIDPDKWDYFFVIRTSASIIGGPSAGAIMTAAVICLLEGWSIDNKTVMTGMINPDGSIGPIGGIIHKIDAAYSVGATRFLLPKGQMMYEDVITETISEQGITQIITKSTKKNLSDYAYENYNMEVVEVEDINDGILYLTGYSFSIIESENSISTEDYINSMKPLAIRLLDDANSSYNYAIESFDSAEIPNRYPYYYKNQITDFLNDAKDTLDESEEWYQKNVYYTSTSKSFQSLINSQFVIYSCDYFGAEDKDAYMSSLLEESVNYYENKSSLAKNTEINGTISLQCVGAAQKRASDALNYLNEAETAYAVNNDDFTALYKIAYAMQRSESIEWWLGLISSYNDTGSIDIDELGNLAEDYIQDAQQAIVYSNVILEEMGKSSSYLTDAEGMLEDAREDKNNGFPAAALFEALESLAKANLALELVDGISEDKIARANESACNSISESRLRGIEPILAVSYYEYAESLLEESVQNAMFYYKYSSLIPGVLSFTGTFGSQTSRYIGTPEIKRSYFGYSLTNTKNIMVLFLIIGTLSGLILGIVIGSISFRKKNEKHSTKVENSQIENKNQQEFEYFPHDDLPRSIKDYYKQK